MVPPWFLVSDISCVINCCGHWPTISEFTRNEDSYLLIIFHENKKMHLTFIAFVVVGAHDKPKVWRDIERCLYAACINAIFLMRLAKRYSAFITETEKFCSYPSFMHKRCAFSFFFLSIFPFERWYDIWKITGPAEEHEKTPFHFILCSAGKVKPMHYFPHFCFCLDRCILQFIRLFSKWPKADF